MVVAALTLAVGGAVFAYPSVAKADCGIAADTNIMAYNISDNHRQVYEENYLSVDTWKKDYAAKYNELNELADDIDSLESYVEEEFEIDWDSLVYIKDVQSKIDELVSIKSAAQERKEEAERIAAERAAAERVAREAQVATYTATNYSNSVPNDGGGSSYSGSSGDFKSQGVIYENGTRYTYYSSNVLYHYRTPEWTAGNDNIYRDSDGYIIVASNDHAQGAVVSTPFGEGKVYDSGCASGTIDIYTNY